MPVPRQGQGLGQDLGLDAARLSPLNEQQQYKLDNSQSSNENEKIDDGGDDQVSSQPFNPFYFILSPLSTPLTAPPFLLCPSVCLPTITVRCSSGEHRRNTNARCYVYIM